jgi:2-desacetyl-2-hydroxyethyl bacteriochlorophyllide A dehydrogenase
VRALIKAARGRGHIEVVDTAPPVPGPGDALVRVGPSGLCGTDLLVHDDTYRGRRRPVPCPLVLGHEACGEVVALGAGVAAPSPGTRVAIEAVTGCGVCHHCVRGAYNLCPDWHHIGLTCAGALAELVVVPAASLLPLPDGVMPDDAALLEPLATAAHTLERLRPRPGTSAAIVGPGPLGLLHWQVLRAAGVAPIVIYGQTGDESRLQLAASLGATVLVGDRQAVAAHANQVTGGIGFDVSVESGGTPSALQTALDLVGGNGTLVSLGIVRETEIDALQVMRKNLTWIGVVSSVRRHFAEAIDLIASGAVKPSDLVTHRLPLSDALEGFDALRRRAAVKVLFEVTR